jgi:hypothetical protein
MKCLDCDADFYVIHETEGEVMSTSEEIAALENMSRPKFGLIQELLNVTGSKVEPGFISRYH